MKKLLVFLMVALTLCFFACGCIEPEPEDDDDGWTPSYSTVAPTKIRI